MTDLLDIDETNEYPQGDVAPIERWQLDDFADIVVSETE